MSILESPAWTMTGSGSPLAQTGPADEQSLDTAARQRDEIRRGWEDAINKKLLEWDADPTQLRDDDLVPPSHESIERTIELATWFYNKGATPPDRVVPNGEGGVVFEWWDPDNSLSTTFEVSDDGSVELTCYESDRLTFRKRFPDHHDVDAEDSRSSHAPMRNVWDMIPIQLLHIRNEIESSGKILELEDDFDDEGSPAYSEEVWKRAVDFLGKNARWLWETYGQVIKAPSIFPGPDGSIDIHWDDPSYELLINFPADPQAMAGFYGDDRDEISIKGRFDPNTFNHGLLLWLKKAT